MKNIVFIFFLMFLTSYPVCSQTTKSINFLDEPLMYRYNETLDHTSTAGTIASLVLPGLSVIGQMNDFRTLSRYALMYGEAFLLTTATKEGLKWLIDRDRPYTYFGAIPQGEENDYQNSFPSGHTAYSFMGATFLSYTFSREYPDSRFKLPVIAGSYGIATGVAFLRVRSGNHFVTDVMAGAAIGSLYGWLIPRWQLKTGQEQANVSVYPAPGGLGVAIRF